MITNLRKKRRLHRQWLTAVSFSCHEGNLRLSFKGCKIKATIYDNACFSVKGRKIFFF